MLLKTSKIPINYDFYRSQIPGVELSSKYAIADLHYSQFRVSNRPED